MKKVILTVAKTFMKDHPRCGDLTKFKELILDGIKEHTIREDRKGYWYNKIKQVARGEAVLQLVEWSGKPYASRQRLIVELTNDDGVDCIPVYLDRFKVRFFDDPKEIDFSRVVAEKDGLSTNDFRGWFGAAKRKLLLIHFTKYRYLEVTDNKDV